MRGSVKMDKIGVASRRMTRGNRDSLMLAIGRGDTEAVKRMLEEGGVDPNDPIHKCAAAAPVSPFPHPYVRMP